MPGQAGTLSEAANRVSVVWALVWWGGTAKQADRQEGREGEGLNKSLPSSQTDGCSEKGKGRGLTFLASNEGERKGTA